MGSIGLWIGCALGFYFGRTTSESAIELLLLASFVGCLVLGCIAFKASRRTTFIVALFCLLGVLLGFAKSYELHGLNSLLSSNSTKDPTAVEFVVLSDSSPGSFSENALISVIDGPVKGNLEGSFPKDARLLYGQRYRGNAKLSAVDYSSSENSWTKGSVGKARFSKLELLEPEGPAGFILQVRKKAIEAFSGDSSELALLQALICGYRREISGTDVYNAYQTCGLAHMIAVSGAHLVIVCSLVNGILLALRLPRRAIIVASLGFLGAYLLLSGAPISALRAALMSCVAIISPLAKRRPFSLNALGCAITGIIATSPEAALSVSFTLSALSTMGIVLFSSLITNWLRPTILGAKEAISDAIALTAASSLMSQLYACSIFSLLPVVSPVANLVSAPFFPALCSLGLAGGLSAAFDMPFGSALIFVGSQLGWLMNLVVEAMAALPFASIPFGCDTAIGLGISAAWAAMLWAFWPGPKAAARCFSGLTLALALYCFLPRAGDTITMLNVGQGDAFLLESAGKTMLIDTGNQDAMLRRALSAHRLTTLDAIAITHADDDHCGSLDVIESAVVVDKTLLAAAAFQCQEPKVRELTQTAQDISSMVVPLAADSQFSMGNFTITVLWPKAFEEKGGNGDSLCFLVSYDGDKDGVEDFTALFTGDAEKEQLGVLVEKGELGAIDLLKVGHHGSKNALTPEIAAVLRPKIALIGVGEKNRYGHPAKNTLEILEEAGAQIFRTDQDGEVTCQFSPSGINVAKSG